MFLKTNFFALNKLLLAFLLVLNFSFINAAERYWVGGSGNWNNTANWSAKPGGNPGASIPTEKDDVFFDNHSFNTNEDQVIISSLGYCKNFNWNTPYTGNLNGSGELNVGGAFYLDSKVKIIIKRINFLNATAEIFTPSRINSDISFISGNWTLLTNLVLFDNNNLTIKGGTINADGKTILCNDFITTSKNEKSIALEKSRLLVLGNFEVNQKEITLMGSGVIRVKGNMPALQKTGNTTVIKWLSGHTVTTISTRPLCNGDCNGTATANVTPAGAYTYNWNDDPITPQTTQTAVNLCANTYIVEVTDPNDGSISYGIAEVIEPPKIIVNFTPPSPMTNCFGSCDGSVNAIVVGGTPTYTYQWCNGSTLPNPNNLCSGPCTLIVTDANGCDTSRTINIGSPPPVSPNATSNNVTCNGNCDGSASSIPSGGTPSYVSYSWSPDGEITSSISNKCPGQYVVTVTDSKGCIGTDTVNIIEPPTLTVSLANNTLSCAGVCDGQMTATVSGGTPNYIYSWNDPSSQSTQTATNLCAGTYQVTVTDSAGCSETATADVIDPPPIFFNFSSTDATCPGLCDGTATLNPSGGTSPYIITWCNGQTGNTATGLCANTPCTVTVTDALFCSVDTTFTINEPPALVANDIIIVPTCYGDCDGSIELTIIGGTPGYTVVWNTPPFGTGTIISNLCAGTYTATITDLNGCSVPYSGTVNEPDSLIAIASSTPLTCNGICDGTVSGSAIGGVSPYSYSWTPGNNNPGMNSLCADTYNLIVTDDNGCSASASTTVGQPQPINTFPTFISASCAGVCDGTVVVGSTGGTPGYTYEWWNGALIDTGNSVSNLCIGAYNVITEDATGCKDTSVINITPVISIAINVNGTSILCNGDCNGQATASASGGVPPYFYQWSTGLNDTNQTVAGLCDGSYTITVTDANGCSNSETVVMNEPPPLTLNLTSTNPSCGGLCDGTASSSVTGGTGTYTYSWSTGPATPGLSNLCPNTYTLTVTDQNNCTETGSVTLTSPTPIVANEVITHTDCGLSNGSIVLFPSGGAGGYTYSWGSNDTLNIDGGIYPVTITDLLNCSESFTFMVNSSNGPDVVMDITDVTCFGDCDGEILVTITGGTPGYTYSWTPTPPTGLNPTGLCPGVYIISVTDADGCVTNALDTIHDRPPVLAGGAVTNVACLGDCNGSIVLTPSGGNGPNYTYSWTQFPANTTSSAINLCSGSYEVIVTDVSGLCSVTETYTIGVTTTINLNASIINANCNGTCNGSIVLNPSVGAGGTGPYDYVWDPIAPNAPSNNNLCAGDYDVIVTHLATGCSTTGSYTITQPTPFVVTPSATHNDCFGDCNGTASVSVSGSSGVYSYNWGSGNGTPSATTLCAGTYPVIIWDTAIPSCSTTVSIIITEQPQIVINASSVNLLCNSICTGSLSATASGGTGTLIYTWTNGSNTLSGANHSNLCPGTYTLVVSDGNGCQADTTIVITEPTPIVLNESSTNATCFNVCNGTAEVSPSGGTPGASGYIISWGSNTISGLCGSQSYPVTVTDANGCVASHTFNITEPSPIQANIVTVSATCGQCDGSASASPTGGVSPYSLVWSNGPNNLCAGSYTLDITDANNCTVTFNFTINNLGAPVINSIATTDATCYNSCNGTANINATGDNPPFTYNWGSGPVTTNTNNALCAGTYSIPVEDAIGCVSFAGFTINQPDTIFGNPVVTNVTCPQDCDGTITLSPTGGDGGPYTYSWSGLPGNPNQNNLCIGTYTVTITDGNGCAGFESIGVIAPNAPSSTAVINNVSCFGYCDGVISLTTTGTNPPFTYSWNHNGSNNQIETGLCAGVYTVSTIDNAGCISVETFTVGEPTPVAASGQSVSSVCGECNGQATVVPSGGTAPYAYAWSNPLIIDSIATGLCSGVHPVTVTDFNGCNVTINIPLSDIGGPTATNPSISNVSCFGGNDGSITLAPSGGTPPYSYNWVPASTSNPNNNLSAGPYFAQVSDSNGCILVEEIIVGQPSQILANADIINPGCQLSDGSITLNPSGGSGGGYTYVWLGLPGNTNIQTGLAVGIYEVTITDGNNCFQTYTFSLSDGGPQITTFSTNVSCNGLCDGTATVSVIPGTGSGNYTYTWSPPGSNPLSLCAGTYYVGVTDNAIGCTTYGSVTISEPAPFNFSLPHVTDVICAGQCNGTAIVLPTGGTLPYIYSWSNDDDTQQANDLCEGTATVVVTDANGCSSAVQSITVSEPLPLSITSTFVDPSCSDVNDGSINITVSGGTSGYSYQWSGSSNAITEDLTNVLPGLYTVTVTDANGCSQSHTVVLTPQIVVNAVATPSDTAYCIGSGPVTLSGSGGDTYEWFVLPSMNPIGIGQQIIVDPQVGTTQYVLVATVGPCVATDTVTVIVHPLPVIDAGPDISIVLGTGQTIGGSPTGPAGSSFVWTPSEGVNNASLANPIASPVETTVFYVTANDINGCTSTDSVKVTVIPRILFSDGLTPNGDGLNDFWIIDNVDFFPKIVVEVYNRWGELLFKSAPGYPSPWDGKYNGQDLPVGSYYYIINLHDERFEPVTGPITIMR
jgi:gliding motility-associated-like protein